MDADDLSAEVVAVDILNGLNVYRSQPNIDAVMKRIIAYRKAVWVEACRKEVLKHSALSRQGIIELAQALAGVGEEK